MRNGICRPKYITALAAPSVGVVKGTLCTDRNTARIILADRVANGEAFPGERVTRVPARIIAPRFFYWRLQ